MNSANCNYTVTDKIDTGTVEVKQKRKNEFIYILRHISQATSLQLTSGAFATAFMLYIGLNTEKISVVSFATNLGLFVASVLVVFAYNWDKSGLGIIRIGSVLNILIPAGMLIAGYLYGTSLNGAYLILIVFSFIGSTAFSIRNSAEINAVPKLFGRERYALLVGRCGYLGGIVTLGISLTTIFLLGSGRDIGYYRVFFLISTILLLIYGALSFCFKRPSNQEKMDDFQIDIRLLFTKKYLIASIPHLTRGIGAAALALWPATILSHLEMTPFLSSMLILLAIIAEIIGSYLYLVLSRLMMPGIMTMIGFIGSAVFLFLTPAIQTVPIFFGCYFCYYLLTNTFSKALMATFVYSCNKEELALVSSFHVLYYALTYCPAVVIFGKFMDDHTMLCMGAGAIFFIISGIMMHFFFRHPVNEKEKS